MPDQPDSQDLPPLRVATGWVTVLVTGPPDVRLTVRGYAPILPVKVEKTGLSYVLYISARSIAEPLEAYRKKNKMLFEGLRFQIRKSGVEALAPYEVQSAPDVDLTPNP
jgi:hypothetical protein